MVKRTTGQRTPPYEDLPKIIHWIAIAGPKLEYIQSYDYIYDDVDLKIRKIDKKFKDL